MADLFHFQPVGRQFTPAQLGHPLGPLPPYVQIPDFLPQSDYQMVFDWVVANQGGFRPARVSAGQLDSRPEVDPRSRQALGLGHFEPIEPLLRRHLLDTLSHLVAGTGTIVRPTEKLELELSAYGDGGHFHAHRDISVGRRRVTLSSEPGMDRVLSAVYYLHQEPRAFTGGELRLYRFGADTLDDPQSTNHIDIVPTGNSLVAFSPWVQHEVRRVTCSSEDFGGFRLSLNCWFLNKSAAPRPSA